MKNLILLISFSVFLFSCKPSYNVDNLPKPLPEKTVENNLSTDEAREMDDLKSEIIAIAKSEKCTNPADWKHIGLGAKPCGGPVEYIAYSNKIDVKNFLEKVALYNQKSLEYNKKYNLVSDFIMVMPPEIITCENEGAQLK